MSKYTENEIINKILENQYKDSLDLSKFKYSGLVQPAIFICKIHNLEYKQRVESAVRGSTGCPICKRERHLEGLKVLTKSQEQFIKEANLMHNNKFDYSKVNYINCYTPVTIICPEHGEFTMKPAAHIYKHKNGSSNHGCLKCAKANGCGKLTREEYINKANKIHNYRFTYNNLEYKSYKSPVIVTCPIHGDFETMPFHHIAKTNPSVCNKCLHDEKQRNFIAQAKLIHGDTYDYSRSVYTTYTSPTEILCKKHGSFWQAPNNHLAGSGCLMCSESAGEKKLRLILEYYKIPYIQEYKIKARYKGKPYKIDFFIPIANLGIEYHGTQHYRENIKHNTKLFLSTKSVEAYIERDEDKFNRIRELGFRIEYIKYDKYDNLEQVVSNILRSYIKYYYKDKYYTNIVDIIKEHNVDINTSNLSKFKAKFDLDKVDLNLDTYLDRSETRLVQLVTP